MKAPLLTALVLTAMLALWTAPHPLPCGDGPAPNDNDQAAPATTEPTPSAPAAAPAPGALRAVIRSRRGEIVVELFPDKAPLTVANFVNLAQRRFYDGLTFHRVVAGATVEAGCPQNKGLAGPGYKFEDEFHPALNHDAPGTLSMANLGPNTNGSRFFIDLRPNPAMDGRNPVFGRVVGGMDILKLVAAGDVIDSLRIEGDPSSLLARFAPRRAEWNRILDVRFPIAQRDGS